MEKWRWNCPFADKTPFNYQANLLIETLFPESNFRLLEIVRIENYLGRQLWKIRKKSTFTREIQMNDIYKKASISHI